MIKIALHTLIVCILAQTGAAVADDSAKADTTNKAAPVTELKGEIKGLAPFLGNWEINAEWAGGRALWARSEFRVGLGGRFVEAITFAREGDGKPYERYRTIFAYDATKKQFMSYGFVYDGTARVVPCEVGEKEGHASITSSWTDGQGDSTTEVKQVVTIIDEKAYGWQVWVRSPGGEWSQIMDGQWKRVQ